jgi:hypothetical protein
MKPKFAYSVKYYSLGQGIGAFRLVQQETLRLCRTGQGLKAMVESRS